MRLVLEGTPDELQSKREQLVKALIDQLGPHIPEIGEALEKALPKREPQLKYRVLRDLEKVTTAAYKKQLEAMVGDIEKVLRADSAYRKSLSKAEEEDDSEPVDEDRDPDVTEEGEPILDPVTNLTPTETKEAKERGEIEEEPEEDEDTEKSEAFAETILGVGIDKLAHEEAEYLHRSTSPTRNCANCEHFLPPGECSKVVSPISPRGWCRLFWYALDTKQNIAPELVSASERAFKSQQTSKGVGGPENAATGLSKAGPFIGPRGGKWADAKHTIPWKEGEPESAAKEIQVTVHEAIGGGGKHTFRVVSEKDGEVFLSRHKDIDHGPTMPKESVKHFVNDLAGKVDLPKSDNPDIQAVISGKAKFLGKGDDGLAFKAGDKVVKVSTTVPFQPENPGHRTPKQAIEMLRKQSETGNLLADKGIEGVQRSEFVVHGDKGFQIKPFVEIPEKFTREQLDAIQDTLLEIHKAGYSVNDDIQAGLHNGKPVMFDVGKADKIPEDDDRTGIYSRITMDMDNLSRLYRDHGQEFVRRDYSEGQKQVDRVLNRFDDWIDTNPKFAHRNLTRALEKRAKELKTTLSGKKLKDALGDLDDSLYLYSELLRDKGFEVPEMEETVTKSLPQDTPLPHDHTEATTKRQGVKYEEIKTIYKDRGFTEKDFAQGGRFHGMSNNELVNHLESLKANNGGE